MKYKNVIWEGRYQPIHKGHVSYIQELLKYAERVWIFIVANETSQEPLEKPDKLPVPEFSKIVDRHHVPEKNPLPFWLRYLLVEKTIREVIGDNAPVVVWGGRRLDLAWSLYSKTLPPDRIFITPERDSFEDEKAKAWKILGEQVIRLEVNNIPKISGTMIRERVQNGQPTEDLLYPVTEKLIKEYGYYNKLSSI